MRRSAYKRFAGFNFDTESFVCFVFDRWLGSTQFQTHHARRAFPCFDEPQFKATFDVNLIRPRTYNTVSNTRLISSTPIQNG